MFPWAESQTTRPTHCIFVPSMRRATTPQPLAPQARCDLDWESTPLSAWTTSQRQHTTTALSTSASPRGVSQEPPVLHVAHDISLPCFLGLIFMGIHAINAILG